MTSVKNQCPKWTLYFGYLMLFVLLSSSCRDKAKKQRYKETWDDRVERHYQKPENRQQQAAYPAHQNQYATPKESYPGANRDLEMLKGMAADNNTYLAPVDPPYIQECMRRCQQGNLNACNYVNNYRYQMAAQYGNAIQRMEQQRRY
jgi:hypothetical protein